LVRTCRISSFCTVAWQLARFQLTRRIARSLGDSWACCFILVYNYVLTVRNKRICYVMFLCTAKLLVLFVAATRFTADFTVRYSAPTSVNIVDWRECCWCFYNELIRTDLHFDFAGHSSLPTIVLLWSRSSGYPAYRSQPSVLIHRRPATAAHAARRRWTQPGTAAHYCYTHRRSRV